MSPFLSVMIIDSFHRILVVSLIEENEVSTYVQIDRVLRDEMLEGLTRRSMLESLKHSYKFHFLYL